MWCGEYATGLERYLRWNRLWNGIDLVACPNKMWRCKAHDEESEPNEIDTQKRLGAFVHAASSERQYYHLTSRNWKRKMIQIQWRRNFRFWVMTNRFIAVRQFIGGSDHDRPSKRWMKPQRAKREWKRFAFGSVERPMQTHLSHEILLLIFVCEKKGQRANECTRVVVYACSDRVKHSLFSFCWNDRMNGIVVMWSVS